MKRMLRVFLRIAFAAGFAFASCAQAAPAKQFFVPVAPVITKSARPEMPVGVKSIAAPVRFNREEMFSLVRGEEIQLALPGGLSRTVVFQRAIPHGGGISSWIGYFRERGIDNRVLITSGPSGSFGVIDAPEGTYRIVPGEGGHDWLVDMNKEKPFIQVTPEPNDERIIPPGAMTGVPDNQPTFVPSVLESQGMVLKTTPTPTAVIDLMVVVTSGLAQHLGANLMTRLYFLVTRANQTYSDSEIAMQLRLVKLAVVDYSDTDSDTTALDDITPAGGGGIGVFSGIEPSRAAAGADLVSFLRDGSDFGGSGLAWIQNTTPDAAHMYSVITGCVSGCESVFIHELGHNMGNRHDRYTNAWQAGGTLGTAFSYSYGYAFCKVGYSCTPDLVGGTNPGNVCSSQPQCLSDPTNSNFRDIMAYFQTSTAEVYRFSNPNINCAASGGDGVPRPCGVSEASSTSANAALSMNNNRANVSGVKAQVSATSMPGSLQFTQTSFSGTETGGIITFTVSRMRDSALGPTGGGAVSVNWSLTAGTATAGSDYVDASGTLTWADSDFANKTFSVTIVNDSVPEPLETFTATLTNPTGAAGVFLGYPYSASGNIESQIPWPPGGAFPSGWTTPSGNPWAVATDFSDDADGTSLKSGAIPFDNVNVMPASATQFTANFAAGAVSFDYKVDSYPGFGFFEFLVDGTVVKSDSGDSGWQFFTTTITAGTHTLQWRYRSTLTFACKFANPAPPQGSACADRAWIDAVNLPSTSAPPNPPRLLNISTRGQILTGFDVMIGGFVISGPTSKTVVIRAIGPSLANFGVTGTIADPTLTLTTASGTPIASNDNWTTQSNPADVTAIQNAGLAPSNIFESAIITTLAPGAYTAIVSGMNGSTGVGLVEAYEIDHPETDMINISTRGRVGSGGNVMIGGFVVTGSGPQNVVIRAIGPSLANFGISTAIANPTLAVTKVDGTPIASNDDWQTDVNSSQVSASGFAPSDPHESALFLTLQPGAYTAIVSGVGGTTGTGLVEVYTTP